MVEGARYATLADENRISARLVAPPRGRLLDRSGVVVAGNQLNWRALLIAEETEDVGATLDDFSRIVPLPDHERARIEREVRRHRRFIPILVSEFLSWEDMARIEVNAPDLPGIIIDVGTTRQYPFSEKLAHVVGYVAPPSEDDMGDDPMLALARHPRRPRRAWRRPTICALRGRAGVVQLEVNAVGRVIRELDRQEGVPGQDVTLTIDAGLQQAVLSRLGDESASAVVMDCRNGEVLAMVTNPSFDPSLFNSGVSQAQWIAWTRNRRTPLINKAAAGVYAPGSTFKMAVALAGLRSQGDHAVRPGELPRLSRSRRHPLPLLAQGRPRLARPARRAQAQLRRFFLRGRASHRDRPYRRDGAPARHGRRPAHRPAGRAARADPDPRLADGQGQGVEHRRHHRQRHRPGLHPGDADAARHLRVAHRHRARGACRT